MAKMTDQTWTTYLSRAGRFITRLLYLEVLIYLVLGSVALLVYLFQ